MEGLFNVEDYAWKVYANTSQMSVGAGHASGSTDTSQLLQVY